MGKKKLIKELTRQVEALCRGLGLQTAGVAGAGASVGEPEAETPAPAEPDFAHDADAGAAAPAPSDVNQLGAENDDSVDYDDAAAAGLVASCGRATNVVDPQDAARCPQDVIEAIHQTSESFRHAEQQAARAEEKKRADAECIAAKEKADAEHVAANLSLEEIAGLRLLLRTAGTAGTPTPKVEGHGRQNGASAPLPYVRHEPAADDSDRG